ncbi:hypothetical protein JZ751_013452 [Albula glossodonta]|uniref:NADP-dependent oxidoreductase domain-containing protein n=1 Tax=Albula glossodonta TaxID=121402 RepID=A0A8T2MZ07_9TELE|nr:hypothetical protein JZ751_013452 [Albula glossodonta]
MTYVINQGMSMYWGTSRWTAMEIMVRKTHCAARVTGVPSVTDSSLLPVSEPSLFPVSDPSLFPVSDPSLFLVSDPSLCCPQEAYSVARQFNLIPPVCEQAEYHFFQRDKVEVQLPELYHKIGRCVGVVSWSPLACGIITGKYENGVPESSRASMKSYQWLKEKIVSEDGRKQQAKLKELGHIAEKLSCTLPQLAVGKGPTDRNNSTSVRHRPAHAAGGGALRCTLSELLSIPQRDAHTQYLLTNHISGSSVGVCDIIHCKSTPPPPIPPNTDAVSSVFLFEWSELCGNTATQWTLMVTAMSPVFVFSLSAAWCLRNEGVSSVLLGTSNPDQLTENLGAIQVLPKITADVASEIDHILGNKPHSKRETRSPAYSRWGEGQRGSGTPLWCPTPPIGPTSLLPVHLSESASAHRCPPMLSIAGGGRQIRIITGVNHTANQTQRQTAEKENGEFMLLATLSPSHPPLSLCMRINVDSCVRVNRKELMVIQG